MCTDSFVAIITSTDLFPSALFSSSLHSSISLVLDISIISLILSSDITLLCFKTTNCDHQSSKLSITMKSSKIVSDPEKENDIKSLIHSTDKNFPLVLNLPHYRPSQPLDQSHHANNSSTTILRGSRVPGFQPDSLRRCLHSGRLELLPV